MASKLVFIVGLAIVPLGCFTGAAANGLPCNADLDCGVDDKCIDGFCGGPPATATSDPTTSTTTTMTMTATTMTESTGELPCDNPAWECVPEVPGVPDAECDADCTTPRCGDAVLNVPAGEDCDDGIGGMPADSEVCDEDCTAVACGDGHFNAMAEPCDDDNTEDFDGCTNACQVPVVAERFDAEVWTSVPYDLSSYEDEPGWNDFTDVSVVGWIWNGGAWNSGVNPYETEQETTDQGSYAATTRLVSPPLNLPAEVPAGFRLELRFEHSMSVEADGCDQDPERNGDGGIVRLIDGPEPPPSDVLTPDGGYEMLDGVCANNGMPGSRANPLLLENEVAFTGVLDGPVVVDLSDYLGRTGVQIAFEFGTDCIHCVNPMFSPSEWTIDDVIVAAFPIE